MSDLEMVDENEFRPLTDAAAYAAWSPAIILRATYGTSHVDNVYAHARALVAAEAGIRACGHYGYMAAGEDAYAQGVFFGQTVAAHGGLPRGHWISFDDEETTGADETARAEAFMAGAHSVLRESAAQDWGYSGYYFWMAHLGQVTVQGKPVHRWIAAYGQPSPPPAGEELWQLTDTAIVPGIDGACDCSKFLGGGIDQFLALIGATPIISGPAPQNTPTALAGTVKEADMQVIAHIPVGPNGEGWAVFDGGTNSDPGSYSASPAIPWDKFVAATAYGPDPTHDANTIPAIQIDVQDRGNFLFLRALNATPGTNTTVAVITFNE